MSTVDHDRWQELSPYLDQALEIVDADARTAWLAALRQQNSLVAAELDILLTEHRALERDGFLERGPAGFPEQTFAGQTIGGYTVVSPIGQGGMGTVWLAERSDGRFDRRVAIKFLSIALAGREGERFKREGSILARLAHPRIAQLVDAGVSSAGQPYLILEHVEGEYIDQYCDHHALPVESRIGLFLEVLAAVEHAHANLIVHRDLKPSNVLVGHDGHVKLLDFGIAKLLDENGVTGEATRLTRDGGRAMTPEYAAPEQVSSAPITTATDVYALGVLLDVLLTGRHPAAGAIHSHAELVKALVDTEPSRMSDVVPRTDKRRRLLRGDLDTIVRKALKKHPVERYASVSAMADDLRRYQRHEPIRARPDTMVYRAAKFVRRNRLSSAAVVLTIAALSMGLYVANRERVIAEQRFRQLRQLAGKVFELDSAIRNLPGSTQARQRLVSASLEYLGGLAAAAPRDPDLAEEISEGYRRVAGAQGVPTQLNLGDFAKADQSLQKADALIETVLAARPDRRSALLTSGNIAQERMIIAESEHRDSDALIHSRKAASRLERFMLQGKASESERTDITAAYANIALASLNMRLYEDSVRYARRAVEIARANPPITHRVSGGLSVLANALRLQGDLEGALRAIREARELSEHASYSNQASRMMDMYGLLLREGLIEGEDGGVSLNRSTEAIDALQRAFDLTENVARTDPLDFTSRTRVGTSGRELGKILRQRDPERALAVFDLSIKRQGEIRNNVKARRDQSALLAYSSYPLHRLHRAVEAKQRIDAALAILKETKDYPVDRITLGSEVDTVLRALADHEAEEGHLAKAVEGYEQLLDKVVLTKPDTLNDLRDANRLALLERALAELYRRTGDSAKAETLDAKRLDLWHHWDMKLPNNPFVLRQLAQ